MDFESLMNKLSLPVIVSDLNLNLRFLNESAKLAFRMADSQWCSKTILDLLVIRQDDKKLLEKAIEDNLAIKLSAFFKVQKKTSELVEKKMTCNSFRSEATGSRYCLFEIENEIQSSISLQTIQGLGKMTGDLSHALSNPLAVMQINCETLDLRCQKADSVKSETVQKKVSRIEKALNRVIGENQKLKDLSCKLCSADEQSLNEMIPKMPVDQSH